MALQAANKSMKTKESLNGQTILKAGPLSMVYEKGSIRWIRLGDTEIVRMIYSAVRDCNWGTIEPIILDEEIRIQDTTFEIKLLVEYKASPIHFEARYHLSGNNKRIRFELNGIALSDFQKNRIGFCILHPIRECAGKTARVNHASGKVSEFTFPEYISPVQPVKDVRSISWSPVSGTTATLHLTGDVFEMEDQRNWTDASYKTYCTPLELPFPALIKKGEHVSQVVELLLDTPHAEKVQSPESVFSWNRDEVFRIPSIGTAMSSRTETLTTQEIDLLQALPMDHLRVEVKMYLPDFPPVLGKASCESKLLGWPLFIVLYLSENYLEEYQQFKEACQALQIKTGWILPVGMNHLPFTAFDELAPVIKSDFPGTLVGTGVNAYFAELNRSRPSIEHADFVSFTISPQVHAFDNASLVENLQAQAEVVRSARKLFPGKPIFVSPISLKQRFNVVATSEEAEPEPDVLPSSVDPRQRLPFTACWILGSLQFLASAGADLVTYYETVGWKGLIQGEHAPALPNLFPANTNELFPVYEALKRLNGYTMTALAESSHPLQFDGLVVLSETQSKLFLFNFTAEDLEIRLEPAITAGEISSLFQSDSPVLSENRVKLKASDCVEIIL
ncbi:MAG TPA: hypothetical protein VFG54_21055 [Prolixibacteraceae bacterium]|nr:hypothetical protein [Prolixibacteraceae bacterium]